MTYGKKSPSGPPSVYSHVTTRSSANLRSSRSVKSLKIPWYRRPIITDSYFLDVQKASMVVAVFSLLLSLFTIVSSCFDLYCYAMAVPGSTHYGYYIISYQFVYVGSKHVRNALVMFAVFSILLAIVVFVTSIMLIIALRKEYEKKMIPWIWAFGIFTIFRFLSYLFFSIVNDLIFAYNILMCLLWTVFILFSIYGWILIYSLYIELSDLTKLEDLAHLRNFRMLHEQWYHTTDGHPTITECIDSTISSRLPSNNTPQYSINNASGINNKKNDFYSIPGPSTTSTDITTLSSIILN